MDDETGVSGVFRRLVRWATTPPQAYVAYVVCLILVWLVSFYAGTLNPKRTAAIADHAPVSAPRN